MDAHVFRCLCSSLGPLLLGARVEKIQRPTPDLHVFTVYAGGQKRFLMLRSGRHAPLLFFASQKLPAPQEPGAVVMRLRRYCAGRRVKEVCYDWLGRKIALLMNHDPETWLILDLRHGPSLASDFRPSVGMDGPDPDIPYIQVLRESFEMLHLRALEMKEVKCSKLLDEPMAWRDYPFMTPALRKTLLYLAMEDPAEAAALVVDILADMEQVPEQGTLDLEKNGQNTEHLDISCNLFVYCENNTPSQLSAWPLPKCLQSKNKDRDDAEITVHHFTNVLEATTFFGQGVAFAGIAEDAQRIASKPFTSDVARLQRLLNKLDGEEKRLHKMLALRDEAVALQGILYQMPADAKMSSVDVASLDGDTDSIVIKLNPLRTVRENMADMFHQSRRGARGLAILAKRRADIAAQHAIAMNEVRAFTEENNDDTNHAHVRMVQEHATNKGHQKSLPKSDTKNQGGKNKSLKSKDIAAKKEAPLATKYAKLVETFESADGLRFLRGRNAEGNAAVLKLAQPYDIWMHAADGPSAHLIIKRDHAQHEVPQESLEEAAKLVAEKSWQRDDVQAEIMCAYAKDVRAIKGSAAGKVRVERIFTSLSVRLGGGRRVKSGV